MSPVDPTKTLVTISSGKETVKLNFNQIEAETNDDLSKIRQQERALTSAVIRYLYDKERDNIQDQASLLREVERSLQLDQPLPTITIPPTILSIETSVKADLDDKKKEFERNFGIDN